MTARVLLNDIFDSMSRGHKTAAFLALDIAAAVLAVLVAVVVVDASDLIVGGVDGIEWSLLSHAVMAGALSVAFGLPRVRLKSYDSAAILRTASMAVIAGMASLLLSVYSLTLMPPIGSLLFGLFFFLAAVGARFATLRVLLWVLRRGKPRHRVLIYGAGNTGMQLAAALRSHEEVMAVAFVDDNPNLHGMTVAGLKVHPAGRIDRLLADRQIERVILAMPSLAAPKRARIARKLQERGIEVQTLPSFAQLVGADLLDSLSPVEPGRFLNRAQRDIPADGAGVYAGRSIMVTGAGGSIGSELCHQLLALGPRRLVLYDHSELALYKVDMALRQIVPPGTEIVPILGSVTDARTLRGAITANGVEVVLHSAAYKHVPLVEANPLAGVANNTIGSRMAAEISAQCGVERFILISTDKAVRPANVMGATKRMAEIAVQDVARGAPRTSFAIVRFGNVLGSSGSVIPLFEEQIARGGPVTVTHPEVTRYFMTIGEACRLVLLAGGFDAQAPREASVLVLDMGEAVRILDLAEQMIAAAGYTLRTDATPDGDIDIVFTGLRPGEKLHEELLIGADMLPTPQPKILRAREASLSKVEVASVMASLRSAVETGDADLARQILSRCVEGFAQPPRGVVLSMAGA